MSINQKNTETTIYSSRSRLRTPIQLFRTMWYDLKASRELAMRLTIRDISARYRQSFLGVLWAFLPPIATSLTFILLNAGGVINTGSIEIPYPVYVFVGTVIWQLFTDSVIAPIKIVTANKVLLAKINFPRESLVLSGIYQVLFDFLIRIILLVAIFIIYGISLHIQVIAVIFPLFTLMLLGIMIGLFLTPVGVLYTDITFGLTTILSLWFFFTPVVYEPPQIWPLSLLVKINPVSPLLVSGRDLLVSGNFSYGFEIVLISIITFILLIMTWVMYRLSIPILIERMTAY